MAKTILAVDDAPTMRKLLSFALSGAGHRVVEAPDGRAALELLKTGSFDLIISDVNMPNMNGIELTRNLRRLPQHARTPVLIVTTESESGAKLAGKQAGATGWIVKPFDANQLVGLVNRVLGSAK
ncbi:MAG TPA: response regulator [Bryobacteraceae bacterium]|nr:response regulator [Bryobacteraceae bacterium]